MNGQVYKLFLVLGFIFGSIAALMSYLIAFREYEHHYPTRKEPRSLAMQTALFTFLFFVLAMLAAGYFLDNFVSIQ